MPFASESFECPCCGADVTAGASFCRECGASDDSGWNEVEEGFATEEDFDYEDYLEREFSIAKPVSPAAQLRRAFVVIVIVLVCVSLALLSILGR